MLSSVDALASGSVNPLDITNPAFRRSSESSGSMVDADEDMQHHVPHPLCEFRQYYVLTSLLMPLILDQSQSQKLSDNPRRINSLPTAPPLMNLIHSVSMHGDLTSSRFLNPPAPSRTYNGLLPAYIKPLPPRMTADDIQYLWKKGALSIPDTIFRNALLQAYIEYVHPYMPLIELHDFLRMIEKNDGENGKISLVLFQAVMFAGTAFVDMSLLKSAGFTTRKAARKAFYQKARVRNLTT